MRPTTRSRTGNSRPALFLQTSPHRLTNAQLGAELFISAGTAKTHVANIQAKPGLDNRVGIAARAWRAGLADP